MVKKLIGVALLAGLMVVAAATKSEAAFIAYICDSQGCGGTQNTNWFAVADGSAFGTITGDGSANGIISFSETIGGLTFVLNTSQSKPAIGSASVPEMDLAFVATGTGSVWLYAADIDFTGLSPATGTLSANWSGTGTITACIYGLVDNVQGTLANPTCTATFSASPVTALFTTGAPTAFPWAMTLGLNITRANGGTTTGDFLVTAVPEPATLTLFGLGLVGVAVAARRRRK